MKIAVQINPVYFISPMYCKQNLAYFNHRLFHLVIARKDNVALYWLLMAKIHLYLHEIKDSLAYIKNGKVYVLNKFTFPEVVILSLSKIHLAELYTSCIIRIDEYIDKCFKKAKELKYLFSSLTV